MKSVSPLLAQPPLCLGQGPKRTFSREVRRLLCTFWRIIAQVFIPFNPKPESPEDPPEPEHELDEKQIDQCKGIFDKVEGTRDHLEQKAHATFTVVGFLAPVLASIFVYLIGRTSQGGVARDLAIYLSAISAVFLLLAFVSIARAVAVQSREELFLGAVIDLDNKKFRKYDPTFHARGLLYCASVNAAMNAHLAQFVKGAQILTTAAVFVCVLAAVPVGFLSSNLSSASNRTQVEGKMEVTSAQLQALHDDIAQLCRELAKQVGDNDVGKRLNRLEERMMRLERMVGNAPKASPVGPRKAGN